MAAHSKRSRRALSAAALALAAWALLSSAGESVRPVSGRSPASATSLPPRPIGAAHAAPIANLRTAEIADELVISPRGSADDAVAAIRDAGGEVAWHAPSGLLLARFATTDDAHQARAMLAADRRVRGVYTNHVMTGAGIATSPGVQQKWMLAALGLTTPHSASGVTVAVLDTGAAFESFSDATGTFAQAPDLAGTAFAQGYDFVHDDAHPNDDHGHGTHITNIIGASASIVPMAPGATIMPIKVLDASNQGTELGLAEGIRYATDHGAHVINMSLAFPPGYFPSRFLQDAVDYAEAQGVVMIAAAGNQAGDQVTYPAAFRNVIAVGASRLVPWYHPPKKLPWLIAELFLTRAEYSNRGNKLEVVAPAGSMNGDANGDGLPEAVVAQTFAPGHPTEFQYRLWAGTSQASAQVSGLAAGMLAANPALTPRQVRSILGESARPELGLFTLTPDVGRGYVRAAVAQRRATDETGDTRPHYGVAVRLGIATSPGHGVVANATVEVVDDAGQPVDRAVVYGGFSGAASASTVGITDRTGTATFTSPSLTSPYVVAFEVDAVADRWVAPRIFDRPRGVFRIDTCSLELLSSWAFGQGIATSPGMETSGAGIATSPGMTIEGTGVATSPGASAQGAGIATSPGANAPQNTYTAPIAMRVPLQAGELDFVELVNYSWSGSTMPMAVAVDTTWFHDNFPSSPIITSSGAGIATSPITLSAATSFGEPVGDATDAPDGCIPVVVRTFVPGEIADGVAPVAPAPGTCGTDCNAQATALGDIWSWAATGQGIATSPGYNIASQLSPRAFDQAIHALWAWSQFSMNQPSSPVSEFGAVLEAAGIATSPGTEVQGASDDTCSLPLPDETPLDPDAVSDDGATTDPTDAPAADAPDPTVQ